MMGIRSSYNVGACKMIPAVPTTTANVNIHKKSLSNTIATYFQSSLTFLKTKNVNSRLYLFVSGKGCIVYVETYRVEFKQGRTLLSSTSTIRYPLPNEYLDYQIPVTQLRDQREMEICKQQSEPPTSDLNI